MAISSEVASHFKILFLSFVFGFVFPVFFNSRFLDVGNFDFLIFGVLGFAHSLQGKPELRTAHAYLGSSIMALFLTHAALGLNFGLSF